jgi:ribosomal protein S27AE
MSKLVYGLKDNILYHIDEVDNGINCNCVCPNCGGKLLAKHGEVKEHHFAHEAKECDITIAQETALHIIAKEIISEMKYIVLPKVIIEDTFAFYSKEEYRKIINKENLIFKIEKYKEINKNVDNVVVEKYIGNIKPDIVIEIDGKQILCEIAVTHFIDEEKKQKIINLDIPTIEIDLSQYKKTVNNLGKEDLKNIIVKDTMHKKWIYYKQYNKDVLDIRRKNNFIISKYDELNNYWVENFPEQYRKLYHYSFKENISKFWNSLKISKYIPIPWFVNYPINGDILFVGDRRKWQSAIINQFYFSNNGLSLNYITKFIINNKNFKREGYHTWGIPEQLKDSPLCEIHDAYILDYLIKPTNEENVIRQYYEFLQDNKIIDGKGKYLLK